MLEFLAYDFMQRALGAGLVIAVIAPMIGLFLVVRRYSYLADTLAHVSLVGVALGLIARINPIISALGVAIVAAWGIERLRSSRRLFGESVLAIFLSGSLAIALLLMGANQRFNQNLFSYLFGSITTVTQWDVWLIVGLGIVALIGVLFLYKELFLVSLNEDLAAAEGLRVPALNLFMIMLAAVTIAVAMRIVGVLLIGALMVIPVTAAMQFKSSFKVTLVISVLFSIIAMVAGLLISFYLDLPTGATVVVLALLELILSGLINQTKK
ncbi:MAG: metal ABC transporter permease [Candidatus Magasanikbacteria bacterium RIFCSPHIGHO2_01_FULL_41_23]|uniref:Metal ABC transporter permease n=1 Tax=Candidatus Magasanikbacteria bacterium RIFCSPLOWO2_01_FULL_40_15 TaxID=1798686 RepID=A0A1F6N4B6_9BACT|nr:MAG: metal ABC transporter permease [Candidatus Magasanikbacteria bacterium RIFCSPHIGHO2_01_FULL_41_23]OGH67184.1 MAG: metal ABC transporter permease [Candidatus Magasanikbacteria bacterium RIFCSPHIGHO2_02_FULL_41_35]OGH75451.1 MAG: metal ABC transporter permease [Candidatus Magasanikbacteria bacterium RIFCSPHIGHO2_12_FULL_41_16]OGH78721.1 MAG: metal ABC transporter permease [Candidatus Magasanikbacteria bacterium RIFCSPLOWO2_01_FULL_40_15]